MSCQLACLISYLDSFLLARLSLCLSICSLPAVLQHGDQDPTLGLVLKQQDTNIEARCLTIAALALIRSLTHSLAHLMCRR